MNDPNELIPTKYGPIERKHLDRKIEVIDNEREHTTVVKYFLGMECVHRSATIDLKQGLGIEMMLGRLGRS